MGGVQRQGRAQGHLDAAPARPGASTARRRCKRSPRRRATVSRPTKLWDKKGDAPAALKTRADASIEAEYRNDLVYHAQMEPLNAVASVSPDGDTLRAVVRACSRRRSPSTVAAKALGIAPDKIVYHDMLMGGGFGRRGHRDEEYVIDAVRAVERREEAGQGDVDARGRRPTTAASIRCRRIILRAGFDACRQAGRVASSQGLRRGDGVSRPGAASSGRSGRDGIAFNGDRCAVLRHPEPARPRRVPQDSGVAHLESLRGDRASHQCLRDRKRPRRDRAQARHRSSGVSAARSSRRTHARSSPDHRQPSPTWRTGAGSATAARSASPSMDYSPGRQICARSRKSRSTARPARSSVHNVWVALDPGIAVQPDNVARADGKLASSTALGFALSSSASRSRTAWCSSRISTTTTCRA